MTLPATGATWVAVNKADDSMAGIQARRVPLTDAAGSVNGGTFWPLIAAVCAPSERSKASRSCRTAPECRHGGGDLTCLAAGSPQDFFGADGPATPEGIEIRREHDEFFSQLGNGVE